MHLVKRIGPKKTCWPSRKRLMEDTGWGVEKLTRYTNSLVDKGIIGKRQKNSGSFGPNDYYLLTDLMGVYISARSAYSDPCTENHDTEEDSPCHDFPYTENHDTKYYKDSLKYCKEEEERKEKKKEEIEAVASPAASPDGSLPSPTLSCLRPSDSNGREIGEVQGENMAPRLSDVSEESEMKLEKSFPSGTRRKHFEQAVEACQFFEEWVKRYGENPEIQSTVHTVNRGKVTNRTKFLMRQANKGTTLDEMKAAIAWKCERQASFGFYRNLNGDTIMRSNLQDSIDAAAEDGWLDEGGKFVDITTVKSGKTLDVTSKHYEMRVYELLNRQDNPLSPEEAQKYLADKFQRDGWI